MSEQLLDTPTLTPFTQDEMLQAVGGIANALRNADWRPDYLVGIGRGGLVPAAYLSHATGVSLLSLDISAGLREFSDDLVAVLARYTRDGTNLLIVDDINDSGRTIGRLRAALSAAGAVRDRIRFATLIDNIRSTETIDYSFREIDRHILKDWFVFPWESVAPTETLIAEAGEVPERLA